MNNQTAKIYGIGNPLIDILVDIQEDELDLLGLHKGIMGLIDLKKREELVNFIKNRKPSYSCGGSCPNTIITLAGLGIKATLAGKIGKDEQGKIIRNKLKSVDINDNLVESDNVTGTSIILITPDSERTMNTYLGANRFFNKDDIVEEAINNSDFLHFTGYMWDTENQKEAIEKALTIASKNDTKITFDVADPFAVGRYRDDFLKLIEKSCDVVFANNEEARILFDNYDAYECCRSLGKICKTAIVKNGKRGSYISHERKLYSIPLQGPVTPVDTTGAGDIYAAGFLYGLCTGQSIEKSGLIASKMAGQIITQYGAQFSKEKLSEIIYYISDKKL